MPSHQKHQMFLVVETLAQAKRIVHSQQKDWGGVWVVVRWHGKYTTPKKGTLQNGYGTISQAALDTEHKRFPGTTYPVLYRTGGQARHRMHRHPTHNYSHPATRKHRRR